MKNNMLIILLAAIAFNEYALEQNVTVSYKSKIKEITSFNDAQLTLNKLQKGNLVIFDMDHTLFKGNDLIENQIPMIIKELQSRGVLVIGLTYNSPRLDKIERFHKKCEDKNIRFDFYDAPNFRQGFLKNGFYSINDNIPGAMLSKGIIFTKYDKGCTLECFIRLVRLYISRIVFFDNQLNNIQDVERIIPCIVENQGSCPIKYHGYHYLHPDRYHN